MEVGWQDGGALIYQGEDKKYLQKNQILLFSLSVGEGPEKCSHHGLPETDNIFKKHYLGRTLRRLMLLQSFSYR